MKPSAPLPRHSDLFDASLFENSFVRDLPADPETNDTRRQVMSACYSKVEPTPVASPRLLAYSREMAEILGLSAEALGSQAMADILAGNALAEGMDPYAMCYGGHQFGHWAGQLGDGRAISLGEMVGDSGRWELQLKGAGPTPYSRGADGRAVLRSSVREFLCSEAMFHLGVPTTRALSLCLTGDRVVRDMFYDGRPEQELGAVVCRVAPSFLRFGSYEIFTFRRDVDTLKTLLDYTLRVHFPDIEGAESPTVHTYVEWFREVCRRTARMVAHWQRVGFVHGVMNTDNMSVLGLTIDYGPYGWLDNYDPDWTPNTTDAQGRRYRYGYQPHIAQWNLARLAEAVLPLVNDVKALEQGLADYTEFFAEATRRMMGDKLGFRELVEEDRALLEDLQEVLTGTETDMTIFYRRLAEIPVEAADAAEMSAEDLLAPMSAAYYEEQLDAEAGSKIVDWLRRYVLRAQEDGRSDGERRRQMHAANPKYVLRNYLAQLAIDRADEGDPSLISELLEVMRRPYDEQPEFEKYAEKRPDWARSRPGCSMLSCSS